MIVFALRHADRTPADALSPEGQARAELLARMLAESGVRHAWCSDAKRTRATLRPLEQRLAGALAVDAVTTIGPGGIAGHVRHIVDAVKALPADATAVVVGHSDTVVMIIEDLTGRTFSEIAKDVFDKLFVLSIPATGAASVALLRYGEATEG